MTASPSDHVAANREAIVDDLLSLLAMDTQNPPGETVEAVGYLESRFESLGITTDRVTVDPAKPNLLATLPGRADATLLFNGHLDTVPYDQEQWRYAPLGERTGDRIYGRGATDMKGAVAAMVAAARGYVETDTNPPVSLQFAFVSDEEVGGDAGLPALLDEGIDADACVIGESTCEGGLHSVTVADRGAIWLTLEASGAAAHGSRPIMGENAIDRLYAGIETLREEFGGRPLAFDGQVEAIVEESVEYYTPLMGESAAVELFRHPSINLGTIEGGTAINAVPESARARLDIRLAPGVNTPTVIEEIRACADACEGVEIAEVSWSIGTALDLGEPIVSATSSVAESVTGKRVFRRSATGGGDAKTLRNAEIPTVEFALGTDTVHAEDEYTTIDILADNAAVYARLPDAYARASSPAR